MDTELLKKIEKIVVNTGIGKLATQPGFEDKVLPDIIKEFALITGQRPSFRRARQSIAGFKIRQGMVIGLQSTLRGKRMVDFLRRIEQIVFPRVRDFRGIAISGVDTHGNLNIGVREHIVFPEISPETSKTSFGVQITTTLKNPMKREEAITFYRAIGIPFKKEEAKRRSR